MTMTSKTLSTSLMSAFLSLAFSTAFLLSAVGPAISISPATATQDYVA